MSGAPFLVLTRENDNAMMCMANTGMFSEPGVWGIILADVVQHLINAYEDAGLSRDAVRSQIVRVLDAELSNPSDTAYRVAGTWANGEFVPHLAGEGEA